MDAYIQFVRYSDSVKITNLIYSGEEIFQQNVYRLEVIDKILFLPSSINGTPVTEITDFIFMPGGENALDSYIEVIIIPISYQKLGKKNFSMWSKLHKVYLNCSPNALCSWNFAYCDNLTDVICGSEELVKVCKDSINNINDECHGCFDLIYDKISITQGKYRDAFDGF